jgi:hypothetical protein
MHCRLVMLCFALLACACTRDPLVPEGPDTAPPLPPVSLRVDAAHDGFVLLAWTPNQETDLRGYMVFRVEMDGVSTCIDTTSERYYFDTRRSYDSTYLYFLRALDRSGNRSDPSDTVSARAPNLHDPDPPENLLVTGRRSEDAFTMRLTWTEPEAADLAGYIILRSEHPADSGSAIAWTDRTLLDDTSAAPGRPYWYSVVAVDRGQRRSASSLLDNDLITDLPALVAPPAGASVGTLPVFSWKGVSQTQRYLLAVSLDPVSGELWRTAVTAAGDTLTLTYAGPYLERGRAYYWRVASVTKQDLPNAVSNARLFQVR